MPGTCIAIACLQQVAALFNNVLRAQLLGPAAIAGTDVPRAIIMHLAFLSWRAALQEPT